ncbi:hypothetical protein [Brevibacterium linens]|uniref:hypothetical protein n=1 Tax=Brevibacterium linens TaxID=1703 RepID=UPI003F89DCB7
MLRTAMMGSMQVREGMERRKQQVEREAEKAAGERQAKERELFQRNDKVASAVQREVQSPMFWNHADNRRVANLVSVSQELAGKHPQADAAYMGAADVLRDKYGIKLDSIMNGPGNGTERHDALLAALDDHNAAGRLREESEEADLAAAKSKQDVENSTPAEEEKYSEHLRTAAAAEAQAADMPVEHYLDALTDEQRETLSSEADKGIEDSPERDQRIDHAKTQAEVSEVPERTYDTEAEVAKDDAAMAQKSEGENLTRAAQALPESDHQQAMDKHLAGVAKKDPQAAQARGQALKNVSGSGKDYVKQSMDSMATPRKAAGQKQNAAREHVHQR